MIYIKGLENPQSIKEIVLAMNSHPCNNEILDGVRTYFDKECKFVQCVESKQRSFDDILECVRTYLPDTTEDDLFKVLINLHIDTPDGRHYYPYFGNCSTIKRIKFLFYTQPSPGLFSLFDKMSSPFSWRELADRAGLGTDAEILERIKNKVTDDIP